MSQEGAWQKPYAGFFIVLAFVHVLLGFVLLSKRHAFPIHGRFVLR